MIKLKDNVIIKTPNYEICFSDLCDKESKKINNLLRQMEQEFCTDMNNHQSLRHEILDISNFIKRLPSMISEVVKDEHQK